MARIEKTVFISYRRTDVYTALAVYQDLSSKGYDVFFDYTSISSGDFEQIIVSNIRARAHFVLILTPTALDRCSEPGDWLRREIETAMDEQRNIIPLFFKGFNFGSPSVSEKLTGKLSSLGRYNGLNVHEDYFPAAMNRLSEQYLKVPLSTVLHPVSTEVRKAVSKEQSAVNEAIAEKWEDLKEFFTSAEDKTTKSDQDKIEESNARAFPSGKSKSLNSWFYAMGIGILILGVLAWAGIRAFSNRGNQIDPTMTSLAANAISTESSMMTSLAANAISTESSIETQTMEAEISMQYTASAAATQQSVFEEVPDLPDLVSATPPAGKDGMILLFVPAGEFTMGNTAEDALEDCKATGAISNCQLNWFRDEEPPHTVFLDAFWVDQTEVTNAMYSVCVQERQCNEPRVNSYYLDPDFVNHPVVYVTWNDSYSYCSWAGRRLLTEAEWEKAASWDPEKQIKSVYPWGDIIDCSFANFNDGSKQCVGTTTAVRSYPKDISPYGAFDMAGNVWEWVNDRYQENYYDTLGDHTSNPAGPSNSQWRVLRGGSWYSFDYDVRSSGRFRYNPTLTEDFIGFRCARSE